MSDPFRRIVAVLLSLAVAPTLFAQPADQRPLEFVRDGRWIGAGISYGEYRDGQSPGGDAPTLEHIREDLHLIQGHWNLIRMYGTRNAEKALRVIREDKLPIYVMLGAWIDPETTPKDEEANRSEVDNVIRLANAYPDIVIAINVGNETQVDWSWHRSPPELLIGYLREVRAGTKVPVTTADDYNFWNKPESEAVAAECDFIGLHAYAMWNGQTLVEALDWTRAQVEDIQARHPNHQIVHCETGWATTRMTTGEQGRLIKGTAGEREQELFYRAYRDWATEIRLGHFYFVAFDENWKGGPDPDEVEKHWGLFNEDRTPKKAIARPTRRE
jgi:exo-beta-1,3-glucanase (GH17 family)